MTNLINKLLITSTLCTSFFAFSSTASADQPCFEDVWGTEISSVTADETSTSVLGTVQCGNSDTFSTTLRLTDDIDTSFDVFVGGVGLNGTYHKLFVTTVTPEMAEKGVVVLPDLVNPADVPVDTVISFHVESSEDINVVFSVTVELHD